MTAVTAFTQEGRNKVRDRRYEKKDLSKVRDRKYETC